MIQLAIDSFKVYEKHIVPGSTSINVSVMNFKPLAQTQSLNTFFKAADDQAYSEQKRKQWESLKIGPKKLPEK